MLLSLPARTSPPSLNLFFESDENPPEDRKWDWYVIGGRWMGYLQPKPGKVGELGEPGAFDNEVMRPGGVDIIKKGDVDFTGSYNDSYARGIEMFDAAAAVADLTNLPKFDYNEDRPLAERRDEYWNNETIKRLEALRIIPVLTPPLDEFFCGGDRDKFATKIAKQRIPPLCLLHEGVWYSRGEMKLFGMVDEYLTQDEWYDVFMEKMNSIDDDTLLTVVDCHI